MFGFGKKKKSDDDQAPQAPQQDQGVDDARSGAAAQKADAPAPDDPRKPDDVTDLKPVSWKYTARRALSEFNKDECTFLAAGLTYYAIFALFPAMVALLSLVGVAGKGQATVDTLLGLARELGMGSSADMLAEPLTSLANSGAAGFALVSGLLLALWSASGYVLNFGKAMNRIYETDEGRPVWKLRPAMYGLTALLVVMAALVLLGLVVSGPVAEVVGRQLGIGRGAVVAFGILKWPLILAIVVAMVAMLYHWAPNVKQPKFAWLSVGAMVAIAVWIIGSLLFGLYVANFGSYNKTYGALAGVIVFLLWLWLTNTALLLGVEVDAEVERGRQLQGGIEAEESIQLPPKDDRASQKRAEKAQELVEQGREIRLATGRDDDAAAG